ncbi:unnamed protein product, partial [Strongylus vulgaris]
YEFCKDLRILDFKFAVGCSTSYCYVEAGKDIKRLRSRAKHPAKLHVWGGISTRGTTDLAIFKGTVRMDSKLYCEILETCYLDFSQRAFNGFAKLVQDNAPAHKSAYTTRRLSQWSVRTVEWPAESPDLNPIELVWGSMKAYIRRQHLRTTEELENAIRTYWSQLTPEICQKYISGIQWRMPLVVSARGGNIIERNPNKKGIQVSAIEETDSESEEDDNWF